MTNEIKPVESETTKIETKTTPETGKYYYPRVFNEDLPTLICGENIYKMKNTVRVAIEIFKFAELRNELKVSEYLQRHVDLLSLVFGATPAEIEEKVALNLVVTKFSELYKYVVTELINIKYQALYYETTRTAAKKDSEKLLVEMMKDKDDESDI